MPKKEQGRYFYGSFLCYDDGNAVVFGTVLEIKNLSLPAILEAVKPSTGGQDATLLGLIPLTREEMLNYSEYMNGLAKEKATRFKPPGRSS